ADAAADHDGVVQRPLGDKRRRDLQGPVAQPVRDGVRLLDQLSVEIAGAGGARCAARRRGAGGGPAGLPQKVPQGEARGQPRGERGLDPAAEEEPSRDIPADRHRQNFTFGTSFAPASASKYSRSPKRNRPARKLVGKRLIDVLNVRTALL